MSVEFVRNKTGSNSLAVAVRQQENLTYFTRSKIQDNITTEYLTQWAERNYVGSDFFVNWVKSVFRTENFLAFYKYFRHPLASANLVNNRIKEPLKRVFHAEDSYFKCTIKGEDLEEHEDLDGSFFENKLFDALLFRHNDILIHDLNDTNSPFRELVPIKDVVSIDSRDGIISRICYTAKATVNGEKVNGYLYMDAQSYILYDKDFKEILNVPHDLGACPADYITSDSFADDDVVRKSIFSYTLESFEEYVFLKTIQRMTEPNGAIPVVTQLNVTTKNPTGKDGKGSPGQPMSAASIGAQRSEYGDNAIGSNSDSPLQAGSRIKVPIMKKHDGGVDMDAVTNFLKFFYVPTEAMEYIDKRIKDIEKGIIGSILGDYSEQNESAKNELQVSKSYVNKQDKLRGISNQLTRIRNLSDFKMLALKYGKDSVDVDCFYGSDFFLETEADIYDMFEKSPNAIERRNLLMRLSQNRNRFNRLKSERERILYELLPYASDGDFDKAIERQQVDDITFELQTRFAYYVGRFEAEHGDIVYFWELMEVADSIRLKIINDLIINIIKQDYEQNKAYRALESVQGNRTGNVA